MAWHQPVGFDAHPVTGDGRLCSTCLRVAPIDPLLCRCGHHHIKSLGDDGADAGCERLGRDCDCWEWNR